MRRLFRDISKSLATATTSVSVRRLFRDITPVSVRRLFRDITPVSVRRRFSDIQPVSVRRRFSDIQPVSVRRLFRDITPVSARRLFRDIQPVSVRRLFRDIQPVSVLVPKFKPAVFSGSPYHKWAAKFFNQQLWRALPHQEVDDLLQDACIKYMRCVDLYVYEKCTCRSPKHLMNLFKRACQNMLIDESRKKQRYPEKYRPRSLDTTTSDLDYSLLLDNSFAAAIEVSTLGLEIHYQE